jgi:hypothetical protein
MKVYGLFYGGSNYSAGSVEDVEEFDSIKEAKDTLWRRSDFDPMFPCVDDAQAEIQLFFTDPRDRRDPYPDRILKLGKRGGIISERC